MTCFVSVIVPVYNDPEHIRKALDALVNQNYPRDLYEIIVVDNGSYDATPRVIEEYPIKYPDLVRSFVENKSQSAYAARNKGIREASGEILVFTDSDCLPNNDWIESGVKALNTKNASCGGGRITFFFKANRPNVYEYYDAVRKLSQQVYVEKAGFAATANFFIRKELFDRFGEFRADLISGGDYEFGRRLTKAGEKIIFIMDAEVKHPARFTFQQIYKKTKRIAKGQKELALLGLLEHGRLSWRNWLPTLCCPRDRRWSKNLSFLKKIHLVMIINILRYVNLCSRIG